MVETESVFKLTSHDHVFLGKDHDKAARRTWAVIVLCTVMMIAEIIGGALFGSLALIADGLHMSTHAGALLLAALAYTYARKHADDRSFTFGTGKFGDLAGYSSAIVLAMIALLIGYEAVSRLLNPVPISFNEAIPIAVLGLAVNVASAWLLSGGHHHDHGHSHGHGHDHGEEPRRIAFGPRLLEIEVFEENVPPRFRLRAESGLLPDASDVRTAAASYFHSSVTATIWSRATKFRSHMPSLPWFAWRRRASSRNANWNSRSTITGTGKGTAMARITATTICAPP